MTLSTLFGRVCRNVGSAPEIVQERIRLVMNEDLKLRNLPNVCPVALIRTCLSLLSLGDGMVVNYYFFRL